ncbi:unnamed protein product [Chrysoparadoxa australica]
MRKAWIESTATVYTLALGIRLALIAYGSWQDEHLQVKYTDVDYQVFTDAAVLVASGKSPYGRATYRYPPIVAWLMLPNVWLHPASGKLLFTAADLAAGLSIQSILTEEGLPPSHALTYACCWLLNPVVINVSTRGCADSITAALVLATLHFTLRRRVTAAALAFGAAVHVRVYPIIYALPLVLNSAGCRLDLQAPNALGSMLRQLLRSRWIPFRFALTSGLTFISATALCYMIYGHDFLEHSLLYHLTRTDNRHNFSMYFYWIYLDYQSPHRLLLGLAAFVPQMMVLLAAAVKYADDLSLCLFTQTVIFVVFNKVCTGQYFLWYMSLLPLLLPRIKLSKKLAWAGLAWVVALLVWLLFAYKLEMGGENTFLVLWGASVLFFVCNVCALRQLLTAMPRRKLVEE